MGIGDDRPRLLVKTLASIRRECRCLPDHRAEGSGARQIINDSVTGGHPSLHKGELLLWIDDRDSSNLPWKRNIQFHPRQPFIEKPESSTINSGWFGRSGLGYLLRWNHAK